MFNFIPVMAFTTNVSGNMEMQMFGKSSLKCLIIYHLLQSLRIVFFVYTEVYLLVLTRLI